MRMVPVRLLSPHTFLFFVTQHSNLPSYAMLTVFSTGIDCSVSLPWHALQTSLEQADSDVLMLLDCCAAAVCTGAPNKGVTEAIAASGVETETMDITESSFTQSLVKVLEDWDGRGLPLTATILHSEILSRIKGYNPKYMNSTQRRQSQQTERGKTPIHMIASGQESQRSIVLTAMELPPDLPTNDAPSPITPVQALAPNILLGLPADAVNSPYTQWLGKEFPKDVCGRPKDYCPTVLVSLALEDNERSKMRDLAALLHSVPALSRYAHVESVYKSDSTLLLLTLPVAVWNLLPDDPAVKFVAFVRSWNLVKEDDMSGSYTPRHTNSRLVDFLNDEDEPGLEILRQQPSIGTSLMPDKSDWLSHGSLPRLSNDSISEDPGSIDTDMGERYLKGRSRLLETGANDIPLAQRPPLPQPVLECPFRFLGCQREFGNEGDWASHSLVHFEKQVQGRLVTIEPPKAIQCNFCEAVSENENSNVSWRIWMEHVASHHRRGERLAHARPNFTLIEYLWQQGLMQATQYRELKGPSVGAPNRD